MNRVSIGSGWRPGLRAGVLFRVRPAGLGHGARRVGQRLRPRRRPRWTRPFGRPRRSFADTSTRSSRRGGFAQSPTGAMRSTRAEPPRRVAARSCGSRSGRPTGRSSSPTCPRSAAASSPSATSSSEALEENVATEFSSATRRGERLRAGPRGSSSSSIYLPIRDRRHRPGPRRLRDLRGCRADRGRHRDDAAGRAAHRRAAMALGTAGAALRGLLGRRRRLLERRRRDRQICATQRGALPLARPELASTST